MNIVELHERIRFWIDLVGSTRFESEDIDNALNVAIDNKVRESYDQNRPLNRSDSFQRVQRLRDELGPLVQKAVNGSGGLDVSGTTIGLDNLTMYGWLLSVRVQLNTGSWYNAFPLTYNRKNILSKNPFRRVRTLPEPKIYYLEEDGDIKIILDDGLTLSDAEIYYLARPATVKYGIEYSAGYPSFGNGTIVIATTQVETATSIYTVGEEITISLSEPTTLSGVVVSNYTNCNLRATAHEEISRRAAVNLLMTADMNDKAKILREEIMAS